MERDKLKEAVEICEKKYRSDILVDISDILKAEGVLLSLARSVLCKEKSVDEGRLDLSKMEYEEYELKKTLNENKLGLAIYDFFNEKYDNDWEGYLEYKDLAKYLKEKEKEWLI
jgi:hypothetical protein